MTTSQPIGAFADVARKLCVFCETRCPADDDDLMVLAKILADLNRAALELPDVFDEGDPSAERAAKPLAAGAWSAPFDLYWDVVHPLALNPQEPGANSFGDDMADIYLDLMKGLAQYDGGHADAAAWAWRTSFWSHWGDRLVGAQRALHAYFSTSE
jgi:hypothetical protein